MRHHASAKDMINKTQAFFSFVVLIALLSSASLAFAQGEAEVVVEEKDFGETVQETGKAIGDAIPDSVKEKANEAATKIESWRIKQTARFDLQKNKAQADIEVLKADSDAQDSSNEEVQAEDTTLKNILLHLKLVAISILHFIFKIKVLFYVIGSVLIFSVLRWLYYRLRRPDWDVD